MWLLNFTSTGFHDGLMCPFITFMATGFPSESMGCPVFDKSLILSMAMNVLHSSDETN